MIRAFSFTSKIILLRRFDEAAEEVNVVNAWMMKDDEGVIYVI